MPFGACTTAWSVAGLLSDYVMVDITRIILGVQPPSTPFPLHLTDFPRGSLHCNCEFGAGQISVNGVTYTVRIWIGHQATSLNRTRLASLLASVRPDGPS